MRYLFFGGDQYYPQGGWGDFLATVDTHEEIDSKLEELALKNIEWLEVVDVKEMKVVITKTKNRNHKTWLST